MFVSSVNMPLYARVRKILVRGDESWGAESSTEKVVVIPTTN